MATTLSERPADVDRTIDEVCAFVAARSAEIERARRLPAEVVDTLRDAGWFDLLLPPDLGGGGAALPVAAERLARLARADASTGWTVMIGAGIWCDLVGLDRTAFDDLFAAEDHTILAGVFNPTGRVEAVADGYRVDGRWAFASGCQHATWLYANCIEEVGEGGRLRTVVFRPDQIQIEDTWDAPGLRGTGSHHFRADAVVVSPERTLVTFEAEPCVDAPIVRIPVPTLLALLIASIGVGIAEGAVDDLLALSATKVPLLADGTVAADPTFQHQLATATAELAAARALLADATGSAWQRAADGPPIDLALRARLRTAACWAMDRSAGVVDVAYRAAGSAVLDAQHPLSRRFRDVHTVTQHFLVRAETLTTAGAIIAGQDLEPAVF